ncbi:Eco57I restriction-modification methylase domain-containing protein [candidate division KSB1 bacterium]|nr:Eco57I restriction-modification methylase domain-containing protein [candidate division KSB1 bacterium]
MAPSLIADLCERFERNYDGYRSASYNEAQLRQDFLNPLFGALGWDMDNRAGYAEAYRDVIHEDSLKVGESTKAPDYAFRIGGTRKFFVEAKKPRVFVKDDPEPAYQLRRYAWSAKLPLSILTNFEEFAVYDCRWRPVKDDPSKLRRIEYFKYTELTAKWEFLESTFSREALLKGSFDKYAIDKGGKHRGTDTVDGEFLKEIEEWRTVLARNLLLRNKQLTAADLNFAVARTIDRLLFLRVCEDRGIEEYGGLKSLLKGTDTYRGLVTRFQAADERYNSGLFHFNPKEQRAEAVDALTPSLAIDDKLLKEILKSLYYPESPYEFSVFPADILGQVYEQFLGKVIYLKGKTVDVEYKPEVKKAGGVYYTPTYIVDYIVKHTVGKLLEGKTPDEVSKLRVLDPACGSGSFLIGAYQHLLDWHLRYYTEPPLPPQIKDLGGKESGLPPKFPNLGGTEGGLRSRKLPIYQASGGGWKLTLEERKRILLNNIYGVDIDAQAVEVTKLSLLLKVLEGESKDTVQGELKLRHRALPDLGANIKCGNSLIGTDILSPRTPPAPPNQRFGGEQSGPSPQMSSFGGNRRGVHSGGSLSADEISRINPFDWQTEFKAVFKQGGFDAVIGNPPYVRQESLGQQFKEYAKTRFEVYNGVADLYAYFVEQSHRLLKSGGRFGMICSNKWMRADYGGPLREFIAKQTRIHELIDFGELKVFKDAATFPVIVLTEVRDAKEQSFIYAPIKRLDFDSLENEVNTVGQTLDNRAIGGYNWALTGTGELDIIEKMKACGVPLGDYAKNQIYRGILTGLQRGLCD